MKKGISIVLGGTLATLIWMSAVSADRTDKQPVSTTDSCYVYTAENGRKRTIRLERQNDSLFVLRHTEGDRTLSEWQLPSAAPYLWHWPSTPCPRRRAANCSVCLTR